MIQGVLRPLQPGLLSICLLGCIQAAPVTNDLFLGFNGAAPVQLYSSSGTYVQDFGPLGALAVVPDGSGAYFAIEPNISGNSTVTKFDSAQTANSSFTFNDLIVDGANGANNTLWLSSYSGKVYNVSASGSVLKTWSTTGTDIGVAFDGTYVYTTSGNGNSNLIEKWSSDGSLAGTLATPLNSLYGLGYDSASGNFWAGATDFVYELSSTGSLLATLNLPGDGRTPVGALHDGLEVGSLLGSIPNPPPPPPPPPPGPGEVPEPSSVWLGVLGLAMLSGFALCRRLTKPAKLAAAALAGAGLMFGNVTVQLSPSISGGAPLGSTIVWTAIAADSTNASATFTYQFSIGPSGGPLQVRRDYSSANDFPWSPADHEGSFQVQVSAVSSTGSSGVAVMPYTITSRVSGSLPVVSPTPNPLVALYSVPPCTGGLLARVRFKAPGDVFWQSTNFKTCTGSTSLNFYVAGMRANTTYTLQQDVFNGPFDTVGPTLSFTTGAVPNFFIPPYSQPTGATAPNSMAYNVVFTATAGVVNFNVPIATDVNGRLIWYLPVNQASIYTTRPVPGGTFLGIYNGSEGHRRMLQEYDLAGNLVRETNATIVSKELVEMGTDPVTEFHHEAIRFPNGDTAVLGNVERVADQGAGPVDVLGDMVIVLDKNLQVKWFWNEFDHLDIKRTAVLHETCASGTGGCPTLQNAGYTVANDWTHTNSVALTPDGNLVVSSRHQDWVFKVDYRNGAGTGAILWRLGKDGDFNVNSSDPTVWFSHQHDAEFERDGTLTLFDNGNARVALNGGNGHSRGQAWRLDEANKVATPVANIDVGAFSLATGSAQLLSNGNYHFDLGFINGSASASEEYSPSGVLQFEQLFPSNVNYRSFRMKSLYSVD
jgi:hypothetical protein